MKSQASWSFYLCQFSRNFKIELCPCFAVRQLLPPPRFSVCHCRPGTAPRKPQPLRACL
jgi:hypothetical protein